MVPAGWGPPAAAAAAAAERGWSPHGAARAGAAGAPARSLVVKALIRVVAAPAAAQAVGVALLVRIRLRGEASRGGGGAPGGGVRMLGSPARPARARATTPGMGGYMHAGRRHEAAGVSTMAAKGEPRVRGSRRRRCCGWKRPPWPAPAAARASRPSPSHPGGGARWGARGGGVWVCGAGASPGGGHEGGGVAQSVGKRASCQRPHSRALQASKCGRVCRSSLQLGGRPCGGSQVCGPAQRPTHASCFGGKALASRPTCRFL